MNSIIATICYFLQLHRLAYFLNRKRKRIITFHNILPDGLFEETVANGVSNSFSQFKDIIDEIAKRFNFSLDLNDPRTVTITFDDGYRNQVEVAGTYLLSKNIPAYIFISGSLLHSNENRKNGISALTIDLLLHWVSYAPHGEYDVEYDGKIKHFTLTPSNRLEIWIDYIWATFKMDSASKGEAFLSALDKAYPISLVLESLPSEYVKQRLEPASIEQYEELAKRGWQIGWHTYSHYPLAALPYVEKLKELKPNRFCSSDVLSFPYGGTAEVDKECIEIAQKLGYRTAVSNINIQNELRGEWFRSRMSLSSNPILLHFELSGLKYLIKFRKLLPPI